MNSSEKNILTGYLHSAKAIKRAMEISASNETLAVLKYCGFGEFMERSQALVLKVASLVPIDAPVVTWDLKKIPSPSNTTGISQKRFFDAVYTNVNLLIAFLEHLLGVNENELRSLRDFFQSNLRKAVFDLPANEKAVQDTVEQLFIGRGFSKGIDYDRETGRVKISIKESVPDFIVPRLSLAVEIKLTKDKAKSKEIVDEINADIKAYKTKYENLLFVIYDVSSIQDEMAFKNGIETSDGMIQVVIVKH